MYQWRSYSRCSTRLWRVGMTASAPKAYTFPMKLSASYALSAITLLGLKPSSSAGAWEMSVAAWNLVISPPQERPMACGSSIFLSHPRAVLVDTDDRAVGDELL